LVARFSSTAKKGVNMKKAVLFIMLCTGLGLSTPSLAAFDPEVYSVLLAQLKQAQQAYELKKQELGQIEDEKDSLDNMKADLSGHDKLADLDNSLSAVRQNYEQTPKDWQSALTMTQGQNAAQTHAMQSYNSAHPTLTQQDYKKSFSPHDYQSYKNEAQQTRSTTVLAQSIYDKTNAQNDEINKLSKQLDTANTNKEAISAMGRIIAENGYNTVQMNKLLSMLVMQNASVQAKAQDAENDNVKFNQ
jgi:hypothetical protein